MRAGFACTVDITTATRADAMAVPIHATTIREIETDDAGEVVRAVRLTEDQRDRRDAARSRLGTDSARSASSWFGKIELSSCLSRPGSLDSDSSRYWSA